MNPVLKDEDFEDEEAYLLDEEELAEFADDVRQTALDLVGEEESPIDEGLAEKALEEQEQTEAVDVVDEPAPGAVIEQDTQEEVEAELEDLDARLGVSGAAMSYPNNQTPGQIDGVLENPIFKDAIKQQIREEMPPIDKQWDRDLQFEDVENLVRNTYRVAYNDLSTESPALRSGEGT
jgi:hypothetical protein